MKVAQISYIVGCFLILFLIGNNIYRFGFEDDFMALIGIVIMILVVLGLFLFTETEKK